MKVQEIKIGTRIESLIGFWGVPIGTEGIIDEDYGSGIMVAWDMPGNPLPKGYAGYDRRPTFASGILRDGFDKETELDLIEVVGAKAQEIERRPT